MIRLEDAVDSQTLEHGVGSRPRYLVDRLGAQDVPWLLGTVGSVVDVLYPAGKTRMAERLRNAVDGYSTARVVRESSTAVPVALSSEAEKGRRSVKVCTFWVHPQHRRSGIGTLLLEERVESWLHRGVENAHVTVRSARADSLFALFQKVGFRYAAVEPDRYGDGEDEVVLQWKPDYLLDVDPFLDMKIGI